MSIDRASELLGVCRRTVYYMLGDGRLVSIRTLNGSQRVLLDSIAFGALKARCNAAPKPGGPLWSE